MGVGCVWGERQDTMQTGDVSLPLFLALYRIQEVCDILFERDRWGRDGQSKREQGVGVSQESGQLGVGVGVGVEQYDAAQWFREA